MSTEFVTITDSEKMKFLAERSVYPGQLAYIQVFAKTWKEAAIKDAEYNGFYIPVRVSEVRLTENFNNTGKSRLRCWVIPLGEDITFPIDADMLFVKVSYNR